MVDTGAHEPGPRADGWAGPNVNSRTLKRHLLIAGTGRAGTSLLVNILHACGLETEMSRSSDVQWDPSANAGLETAPYLDLDHPYVIKSPWSYVFLRKLLSERVLALDGIIIPVRSIADAASSRIVLEMRSIFERYPETAQAGIWSDWGNVPGGATYSLEPIDQARILAHSLHRLLEVALEFDVPIRFLSFPRFTHDIDHLHGVLEPFLPPKLGRKQFEAQVASIVSDEKIRMGKELAVTQRVEAFAVSTDTPADDLPDLDQLESIALRRELKRLHARRPTFEEQGEMLAVAEDQLVQVRSERDRLWGALRTIENMVHTDEHNVPAADPMAIIALLQTLVNPDELAAKHRADLQATVEKMQALRDRDRRDHDALLAQKIALIDHLEAHLTGNQDIARRTISALEAELATARSDAAEIGMFRELRARFAECEAELALLRLTHQRLSEKHHEVEKANSRLCGIEDELAAMRIVHSDLIVHAQHGEILQEEVTTLQTEIDVAREERARLIEAIVRAENEAGRERDRNIALTSALDDARNRIERLDQAGEARLLKLETALDSQQRLERLRRVADERIRSLADALDAAETALRDQQETSKAEHDELVATRQSLTELIAEREMKSVLLRRQVVAYQRLQNEMLVKMRVRQPAGNGSGSALQSLNGEPDADGAKAEHTENVVAAAGPDGKTVK